MSNSNPLPNVRMTKDEYIARLRAVKAPESIIEEAMNSKISSRPMYSNVDDVFNLAHTPCKLIKTFDVSMDIVLKVYRYEAPNSTKYRLDVVNPDGMIEEGEVFEAPVQFVYNGPWMVDVSKDQITVEDVYVKALLEAPVTVV